MNSAKLATDVRNLAISGADVIHIAEWLLGELGDNPTHFAFANVLFKGLKVPVQVLYETVGWRNIGGPGEVSDEQLRSILQPYVEKLREDTH